MKITKYTILSDEQHTNGVGIILSPRLSQYDIGFTPIFDRIIFIELKSTPIKMNLIKKIYSSAEKP